MGEEDVGATGLRSSFVRRAKLWRGGVPHPVSFSHPESLLAPESLTPWSPSTDGDYAQNNAGWQWAAGCGCDAQPYFRKPFTGG